MKKIMFLACTLLYAVVGFGQDLKETEVPSVVLNTFRQQFPKAMDTEWKLKAALYKVEFEIGKDDHEVWLEKTGKIVKHKEEIKSEQLPKEVVAAINKEYKGYKIHDPKRTDNAGVVTYKVELKSANAELDITYDQNGKVISRKAED